MLSALAIAIIALVTADAYEKYVLSRIHFNLKPVIPSPTVWIDDRDDGRV